MSGRVRLEGVSKRFAQVTAVEAVSLEVAEGAFFALLGPSGCGKTTLLRMIAGFERPTSGRIWIDGEDVTELPPNRRPVNMVFQSYAVFPHMTVWKNVAYGLEVVGTPRAEVRRRVEEALAMVRLEGLAERKPHQLSGGQKQRVALARALVKRPRLLLLDEPLSALDRKLREEMRLELVRLQHEVGITFILVTHDQEEALSTATQIAVMREGRILQVADPRTLYERPSCRFVADFIGTTNLLSARLVETPEGPRLEVEGFGEAPPPGDPPATARFHLAIRPEQMRLAQKPPCAEEQGLWCRGRIAQLAYLGHSLRLFVDIEGMRLVVAVHRRPQGGDGVLRQGAWVWIGFDPRDAVPLSE